MECDFCHDSVSQDRWDAGYTYCQQPNCVQQGLVLRRSEYRLILVPKQGFTYVLKNDPALKQAGRSSGRAG